VRQSDILKSKDEECEAYELEIEVWISLCIYIFSMVINIIV
jgi:hypothetical protein